MHTQIKTYFTNRLRTQLLYTAEDWVRITMRLETAGPVSVGTDQDLGPVLGGSGRLLPVGDDITFTLPRGDMLYIIAAAANRVSYQVEPIPWLQQILMAMDQGFGATVAAIFRLKNRKAAPRPPSSVEVSPIACPNGIRPWKGA